MYLTAEAKAYFEAEAAKMGVSDPHLVVTTRNRNCGITLYSRTGSVRQNIASGALSHFPGCCGIAILHDAEGDDDTLKLMFRVREAMAEAGDKGLCVYTDVVGDAPNFLRSLGYRVQTRSFYNPNSGNRVATWAKRIGQDRE